MVRVKLRSAIVMVVSAWAGGIAATNTRGARRGQVQGQLATALPALFPA